MPIPVNELAIMDYEILNYISNFDSITKKQILNHFSHKIESIEYRLSRLSRLDRGEFGGQIVMSMSVPIKDTSYIVKEFTTATNENGISHSTSSDSFHISPLGRKALQDYKMKKRSDNLDLWLKNAWIPIIVAFVTTLLTNYLLPMLPQILKWLSSILEKTLSS